MNKTESLIMVLVFICFSAAQAYGARLIVDPLHPRSVVYEPSTHSTLTDALADAVNGDEILLRNETPEVAYDFGGPYTIDKQITLKMCPFSCAPDAAPIVRGLVITADNVQIGTNGGVDPTGLQVTNYGGAGNLIEINWADNVKIYSSNLFDASGSGIVADGCSNLKLHGNTLSALGGSGIVLNYCFDALVENNVVGQEDNSVIRSVLGNGIEVLGCTRPSIDLNTIQYCYGDKAAIYVGPSTGPPSNPQSVLIRFNTVMYNRTANGILMENAEEANRLRNYIAFNKIGHNIFTPYFPAPCSEYHHGNSITLYQTVGKTFVKHNTSKQNLTDITDYACAPSLCAHPGSGVYVYPDESIPEPEIHIRNNIFTLYLDNSTDEWRCLEPDPGPAGCPTRPNGECCSSLATFDCAAPGPPPTQETYADYNFIGGPENLYIGFSINFNSVLGRLFFALLQPFEDIQTPNWQLDCEYDVKGGDKKNDPKGRADDGGSLGATQIDCDFHSGFNIKQAAIQDGIDVSMDYSDFDTHTGYLNQTFTITNNLTDNGTPITMYNPQVVSPFVWYNDLGADLFYLIMKDYHWCKAADYLGNGMWDKPQGPQTLNAVNHAGADFDWEAVFGSQLCTPADGPDGAWYNLDPQCTQPGINYPWWSLDIEGTKLGFGESATFSQTFYPVGWTQGDSWWMMNFNYIAYLPQPAPIVHHWYFDDTHDDVWGGGVQTDCNGNDSGWFLEFMELPFENTTNNIWTASTGILDNAGIPFGDLIGDSLRYLEIQSYDETTGEPLFDDQGGLVTKNYGITMDPSYSRLQARVYRVGGGEEVFTLFDNEFYYDNSNPACPAYGGTPDESCFRIRYNAAPLPFLMWDHSDYGYGYDFESQNHLNIDLYRVICEGLYEGKRIDKTDIQDIALELVVRRADGDFVTSVCIDEMQLSDSTTNRMLLKPEATFPANEVRYPDPGPDGTVPVTFMWTAHPENESYDPTDTYDEIYYHLYLEKCDRGTCVPSDPLSEVVYTRFVDVNDSNGDLTFVPYVFGTQEMVTRVLGPGTYEWKIVALDNHGYGDATPVKRFTIEGEFYVALSSFEAIPGNGSVTLQWQTETEISNAGFNLYRSRSEDGPFVKINPSLIPAVGNGVSGAGYRFVDEEVKNGLMYHYRLEDVDTSGKVTDQGRVKARPLKIYALKRR